jgi:hypothetical protein
MMDRWVEREIAGCHLRDARLKQRLGEVLSRLAEQPTQSIPAACQSWAETQAAYRFFENERVSPEDILEGHGRATLARCATEPVVLVVQDTTFLEYLKDRAPKGLGTLREQQRSQYLLHPSIAFTPRRVNLGVIAATFWQRPEAPVAPRAHLAIEQKESYRWLQGYEWSGEVAKRCPKTLVVNVADREGDIQECLAAAATTDGEKAHYLVRAKENRRLVGNEPAYLWPTLREAPVQLCYALSLPARPGRAARTAQVELRAQSVCLAGSRRQGGRLPPVAVSAIYVREIDPPATGALEWMLLTSLPLESTEAARQVVDWYGARWEIELYFRILKQACRVEDLRLASGERLERALAVYQIIAWRVHHLTQIARSHPDVPCSQVLAPAEWRTLYALQTRQRPPDEPPPLRQAVRLLAQLGGFLARKQDGEPGVETTWRGYMRLLQSIRALEIHAEIQAQRCV